MENNPFSFIKNNWVILIFIVTIIMNWTLTLSTVASHAQRIEKIEKLQEARDITYQQIQTDISSIKTSIIYIERALK